MNKYIQKIFRATMLLTLVMLTTTACHRTISVTGVTLDRSTLTLQLNNGTISEKLIATVVPEDADETRIAWTSSAPDVATVSEGVVTAVSVGTAKITVTTLDGNHSASCDVTVELGTIYVEGIMLDKAEISLTPGESSQLTATVTPSEATDKSVIWSSANEAVATVDATGNVSAVGKGETVITATTADKGYSATCTVTVTVPVTGITCSQESITLLDGATAKLDFTVLPENASNTDLTFVSSDPAVASVDSDGTVKGLKAGTAVITATTVDGGFSASVSVTVYFSSNLVIYNESNSSILSGNEIIIGLKSVIALTVIDVTDSEFKASSDMIKIAGGSDAASFALSDRDGTGVVTITALSAGSADLTVTFDSDRGSFEKTIKVTVTANAGGVPDIPVNPA